MKAKLKACAGYAPMRNHDAMNPLMRKGGPHCKTRKALRGQAKRQWRKEAAFRD